MLKKFLIISFVCTISKANVLTTNGTNTKITNFNSNSSEISGEDMKKISIEVNSRDINTLDYIGYNSTSLSNKVQVGNDSKNFNDSLNIPNNSRRNKSIFFPAPRGAANCGYKHNGQSLCKNHR
ncbi:uncharacterized protein LOC142219443 [Haematobia irritans]|uniref:uncharacterized protein LOC142219443 n=1 Tax=Haematobia irritans TaxID=7368 RepID=UPI003F4FF8AE